MRREAHRLAGESCYGRLCNVCALLISAPQRRGGAPKYRSTRLPQSF